MALLCYLSKASFVTKENVRILKDSNPAAIFPAAIFGTQDLFLLWILWNSYGRASSIKIWELKPLENVLCVFLPLQACFGKQDSQNVGIGKTQELSWHVFGML
jgi:hypothetical protein